MPAAAVMAVGSVANSYLANKSAKKAANAQAAAADKATAAQMEMFNKQLELMQPFNQAGQTALPGLQEMAMQQQTPFSFDYGAYFNSPEYAALSSQQEAQTLGNSAATGGLRSGNSQAALAAIAPQLAQQARGNAMSEYSLNQAGMMDRYNRLMGLAGLGMGSAQQSASAAGNFGNAQANNALYAGNAMANKYQQYGKNTQSMLGDLGSLYLGGF